MRRLTGAGHLHVNRLDNKFSEPNGEVIASARDLLAPMSAGKPCTAMPVSSSGQSARQVDATYSDLKSRDLFYATGGIMAHPQGPAAGAAELREAWDAALAGIPARRTYAASHPALTAAMGGAR
ncbi:MAG: RuBisCO large subunit C-terminal-like domain-containing protein [Cypionkella sp.]